MRNVNVRAFFGLVLLSMAAQVWSGVDVRFVSPADVAPDVSLVVPTVNGAPLAELDEDTRAVMVKAVSAAAFGKEAGATLPLYGQSGRPMLLLVELGEEPLNGVALETLGGTVSNALLGNITSATVLLNGITLADGATLSRVALGSKLGGYRFDKYQTETDDAVPTDLTLELADTNAESLQQQWLINGQPLADAVYFSRDLISEPANIIYPESFVARVKAAFKGIDNVRIRVLDEKAMAKQGMEVLLGVGMGSARPPRLLVIDPCHLALTGFVNLFRRHIRSGESHGQVAIDFITARQAGNTWLRPTGGQIGVHEKVFEIAISRGHLIGDHAASLGLQFLRQLCIHGSWHPLKRTVERAVFRTVSDGVIQLSRYALHDGARLHALDRHALL